MVTSSKRAYAIPRSATPRAPASAAGHCWPVPPQETLRHSKTGLIQSLWGLLVCTRFCFRPLSILAGMGFDSKHDFVPPTVFLGLLLCPCTWGIFFDGIQHSLVDSSPAASCNFEVLAGEDENTIFYSANTETRYLEKPLFPSSFDICWLICHYQVNFNHNESQFALCNMEIIMSIWMDSYEAVWKIPAHWLAHGRQLKIAIIAYLIKCFFL